MLICQDKYGLQYSNHFERIHYKFKIKKSLKISAKKENTSQSNRQQQHQQTIIINFQQDKIN